MMVNVNTRYARAIVTNPTKLTAHDTLALHALGVSYREVEKRDEMLILRREPLSI